MLSLLDKLNGATSARKPEPPVRAMACWVQNIPAHLTDCLSDLWPPGTVLRLTYVSKSSQIRQTMVRVAAPRSAGGPEIATIQLSENCFRHLEHHSAGVINVLAETLPCPKS